jgi:hypothetical protein
MGLRTIFVLLLLAALLIGVGLYDSHKRQQALCLPANSHCDPAHHAGDIILRVVREA